MEGVFLEEKNVTFGDFTEQMNDAISYLEVSAKMLEFTINTVRFGYAWEIEVMTLTDLQRDTIQRQKYYGEFIVKDSVIVRVEFNKENEAKNVSIFYTGVNCKKMTDFEKAAELINNAAIKLIEIHNFWEEEKMKQELEAKKEESEEEIDL